MQLQEGFVVFHDGIDGERATPIGAAIIKHLAPANAIGSEGMRLECSGTGVGGKLFAQIPNGLRIIAFEDVMAPQTDRVTVFEFEIDDQIPEDLAVGIEAIRQTPGVMDVTSRPVMSKEGRWAQAIQILGADGAGVFNV